MRMGKGRLQIGQGNLCSVVVTTSRPHQHSGAANPHSRIPAQLQDKPAFGEARGWQLSKRRGEDRYRQKSPARLPATAVKFDSAPLTSTGKVAKRRKTRQKPKKGLDRPSKNRSSRGPRTRAANELSGRRALDDQQSEGLSLASLMHGLFGPPEPTGRRRGRPTIADNFLLGHRNWWLSFFEECWPEIGFGLLAIRKRKTGTIEDVRKVFQSLRGGSRSDHVRAFLCGSPEKTDGKTLRANLRAVSELRTEIQKLEDRRSELEWRCAEAERALAQASEQEKETIRTLADARNQSLRELDEKLAHSQAQLKELEQRLENQQTYWFCSQLLDFLCQARYAVRPLPLANAMAGLPGMGWRASFARTSRMKRSPGEARFAYRVFETISRMW